ncbi:MAG: hypothetical protein ACK5Y6_07795 [Pseudomonadota bacterium]
MSQVEGTSVSVLARSTVRLPLFASKDVLRTPGLATGLKSANTESEARDEQVANGDTGSTSAPSYDSANRYRDLVISTVGELRQTIAQFDPVWTATTVILPQHDFLALNLDLPFGDPRNLDRIVDLEVQDVVPFELESFFVQYSALGGGDNVASSAPTSAGSDSSKQYDVHIGILPRVVVSNVLDICKLAGLEPNVLTVPSSVIGAVYHLGKEFFSQDSAVVYNRGEEYCIAIFINGEVRIERSVYASEILSAQGLNQNPGAQRHEGLQHVFTALKLCLASAERRYNTRIEKVYLLGREVRGSNTHQLFGRPLEGLPFKDILSGGDDQVGLAPLGAIFAKDDAEMSPLSNFRSREFSFTPRIAEFIRALAGTKRAVLTALTAVVLSAVAIYGAREYMISSSANNLISAIKKIIPGFESEPEQIRENLMKAQQKLSEELGAFGSRSKVSAADAFIEIVKNIPSNGDVTVNSIKVSGLRVQLLGSANELAPIERFVKTIGAQQNVFGKVDYKTSRSGSRFNVTIDVTLAQ